MNAWMSFLLAMLMFLAPSSHAGFLAGSENSEATPQLSPVGENNDGNDTFENQNYNPDAHHILRKLRPEGRTGRVIHDSYIVVIDPEKINVVLPTTTEIFQHFAETYQINITATFEKSITGFSCTGLTLGNYHLMVLDPAITMIEPDYYVQVEGRRVDPSEAEQQQRLRGAGQPQGGEEEEPETPPKGEGGGRGRKKRQRTPTASPSPTTSVSPTTSPAAAGVSPLKAMETEQKPGRKGAKRGTSSPTFSENGESTWFPASTIGPADIVDMDDKPKVVKEGKTRNGRGKPSTQIKPDGVKRVGGGTKYRGNKKAYVIDTGIDLNHPDLNVHPTLQYKSSYSSANDEDGHGTHVAGIIAAKHNKFGVVGVAAGATVVPVRVMGPDGSGSLTDCIRGIEWVADFSRSGAKIGDVANLSLGVGGISGSLDQAVKDLAKTGILVAVAAGNEDMSALKTSPARVDHKNVATVSAIEWNDVLADFSNYGSAVDCGEPGVYIYSTYREGGYTWMTGTSMASPHMAGIMLLTGSADCVKSDGQVKDDKDKDHEHICVVP